jgi:MFS family permease
VTAPPASFLATPRGRLTLLLLCAVQFLDVADSSIMNVALPSIRRDLGFSAQGLQWVLSGYLVTYGGLLLLGGRAGDMLGRRPLLVAGTALFAACSLACGLATGAGMLVGAGSGRAPARRWCRRPRRGPGHRRHAAAGLRPGPGTGPGLGQRPNDRGVRHRGRPARRLRRHRAAPPRPAVPVLHLPRSGLAASDVTQMIAFAAFVSVFYFLTLYMQNALGFSPVRRGSAYLPVTVGIVVAAGTSSKLFARAGTRPVIVAGGLIAAAGVFWLARIPVHGTYPASLLPGLVIMAVGIGAVLVAFTTAANGGIAEDKAGLAAGLLNASQQLGTALGLAIFSAIATTRTSAPLTAHAPQNAALTAGFHRGLLACAIFLLAAAVIALRATNSRGEPVTHPASTAAARGQVPTPELTD